MIAYYSNGNPLVIMQVLQHKSFHTSRKHIHTVNFMDEGFDTVTATTPEEIQQPAKSGCNDEMMLGGQQMHFYRKPKRLASSKTPIVRTK